jgi:hypothetical protein
MKKLILIVFAGLVASATFAQSLTIASLDLNPWGSIQTSVIQSQGSIENTNGDGALNVKVRRITVDTVSGTENYFCWEQCYEPPTSESPTAMTIALGQRIDQFYADYKPNGQAGVSTLIYCFYDVANQADSVCATVRFSASPLGIQDVFTGDKSGISTAFPNPAKGLANVNYALKKGWKTADLKVYSMLGAMVKKVNLKEDQGTLKLDVSSLPAGMYFYTLTVDNNNISTKKMLVTK